MDCPGAGTNVLAEFPGHGYAEWADRGSVAMTDKTASLAMDHCLPGEKVAAGPEKGEFPRTTATSRDGDRGDPAPAFRRAIAFITASDNSNHTTRLEAGQSL